MSLRSKIVLILVAVAILYVGVDNVTLRLFAGPVAEQRERQRAESDLAGIEERIQHELEDLRGKSLLYAGLHGVHRIAEEGHMGFAEESLGVRVLDDLDVDLAFFCDRSGKVHWGEIFDPGSRRPLSVKEMPKGGLRETHPAMNFKSGEPSITGLIMTERGPLLVASAAIGGLDPEPDRRFRPAYLGTVILGRFLDDARLERVLGAEGRGLRVFDLESARAELEEPTVVDELTSVAGGSVFRVAEDGQLEAYRALPDLSSGFPLILRATLDREIHRWYRQSMNYLLLSTFAGVCLILFVLLLLLRRIVIDPLSTLTSKATEIGRSDDTTIRVGMERRDEIGQLAGEFDSMLDELALSRAQVIKSARLAGMSEIATGVIHNVGNVLNSVNVAASLVTRKTEALSAEDLGKMVDILKPHSDDFEAFVRDDPRGKHFLPFLFEITDTLVSSKREILEEVQQLGQGIEHIAELVRSQQSFALSKGVFEPSSLEDEVEGTLKVHGHALGTSRVEIVREYEELPSVWIDRHKFMEILVNLIQNARQALDEAGGEGKKITLRLRRDGDRVRIEVADNGIGIAPENLSQVFKHGFTTKPAGHGFGLHVSANAAKEMGGRLTAESEGRGRGATFVLQLPIKRDQEARDAA